MTFPEKTRLFWFSWTLQTTASRKGQNRGKQDDGKPWGNGDQWGQAFALRFVIRIEGETRRQDDLTEERPDIVESVVSPVQQEQRSLWRDVPVWIWKPPPPLDLDAQLVDE